VPVALTLIIVGSCALAAGCWHIYSNTWDEPEHLAAGVELLDRGRYEYDTEHPPLARILLAVGPWLAGAHSYGTPPPDGTLEGRDILYSGGHYWLYLTLARLGALPFLALLLFATWLWARRLLASTPAALLSVALLASIPPILGHGALASLDVAAAATALLAFYALQSWLSAGSYRAALLFGLSAGVAVVTKFSAVPFLALALVTLALSQFLLAERGAPAFTRPGTGGYALGLALAALAALVPVFLAYGPRAGDTAGVALRFDWAVDYLLQQKGFDHTLGVWLTHVPLPHELKDLLNGIMAVKAHNDTGHLAYFMGEVRRDGWWYFYLVALAVKTPIPVLVAGTAGLAWLAATGVRTRNSWALAPAVLVVTILVFASTFSRINIGIRHVLIVYPFLALGAGYVLWRGWRRAASLGHPRAALAAKSAVLALLLWQFSSLWRAFPDYLPYFNEAVREPQRILVDSDLDWGQDLRRLEWRAAQLRIPQLNLAYRGTAVLSKEPLPPFVVLPPRQPVNGWVAVSALARTRNAADYAWLNAYQPLERVGKTIDLYYIP
jgi:4-amino-4-deoxy-L-arabinose transferase-like glycosyltransferase